MIKKHWMKLLIAAVVIYLLFRFSYNSLVYVRASGVPVQPIV
jgi:hypothetical protein